MSIRPLRATHRTLVRLLVTMAFCVAGFAGGAAEAASRSASVAAQASESPCVSLVKSIDGPFRTSDNLRLSDNIIPVGVNILLNGRRENLFYFPVTLTVTNCGAADLTGVVLADRFAEEVQPFEVSDSASVEFEWELFNVGNVFTREYLTWTIGTLLPGESRTLTIKVGTEFNNSFRLEPSTFNRTLLYNGIMASGKGLTPADLLNSAVVTSAEGASAAVGRMSVAFGPKVTCAGSQGAWNKLFVKRLPRVYHDDCTQMTTALPITLTSP
jgi:Domain of unknown function DUF11